MNNKGKAEEIAYKNNIFCRFIMDRIKATCLEMAQWKDEKFSKFLLWLDDFYVIRKIDDGEHMTYGELIDAFKNMEK